MLSRCTVHLPLELRFARPRNVRDELAEHFVRPGFKILQLVAVQRIVLDRCDTLIVGLMLYRVRNIEGNGRGVVKKVEYDGPTNARKSTSQSRMRAGWVGSSCRIVALGLKYRWC